MPDTAVVPPPFPAEPVAMPTPVEPNLTMIAHALRSTHEQVRFADAKASFIAAPNVVLFAQVASQADKLLAVAAPDRHAAFWAAAVLVVAYTVTAIGSLTYVVMAVLPRNVSLGTGGRTHFGHIVDTYGTDHGRYAADLRCMSTADWADDMAGQLVEVSQIADRKHALIRRAAVWMAWSLLTWVLAVTAVTLAR